MEVSFRGVFDVAMIDCVASSSDKNCFYFNSFLSECDSSDLNLRKQLTFEVRGVYSHQKWFKDRMLKVSNG